MKAIRVHATGDPDVMKLEEVPDLKPGAGEVLVSVRAAGVNPVDTYIRAGIYGALSLPYTPGMDAAGVVQSIGEGVTRVKEGDRVYTAGTITGAYAEQALCLEKQVYRLPDRISFQQGAGVYVPYATAYRALFLRANAQPGETVLVHGGSGGVGTAAIQIGSAAGFKVIATGGTEEGRELARRQGAAAVLDHSSKEYLGAAVAGHTAGRGFDIILEMLANVNLDEDLSALAKNGRVVVIGSRGRIEIDPRKTMAKDASILGMTLMNTSDEELIRIHSALIAGMENGTLNPVIGKEFPLAEASRSHDAVMAPGSYGKIVLIP